MRRSRLYTKIIHKCLEVIHKIHLENGMGSRKRSFLFIFCLGYAKDDFSEEL
jgi:hypothetical protein